MNKEYIKELFEEHKEKFIDSEYEMERPEDLENLIEEIVISNLQYDFHIYPDANKLFNKTKEVEKDQLNENIDLER